MRVRTPHNRYGKSSQALHWLTALLVLAAFVLGPEGSEQRIYAPEADFGRRWHESLGLAVFTLTVLRVLWRQFDKGPAPVPMGRWMTLAGRSIQGLLYVLLFAVPLTAVAGAWLSGHPLTLLGGLDLAPGLKAAPALGHQLSELHGLLSDGLLLLAGLHAGAALLHHLVLKDRVLVAMLPRWLSADRP